MSFSFHGRFRTPQPRRASRSSSEELQRITQSNFRLIINRSLQPAPRRSVVARCVHYALIVTELFALTYRLPKIKNSIIVPVGQTLLGTTATVIVKFSLESFRQFLLKRSKLHVLPSTASAPFHLTNLINLQLASLLSQELLFRGVSSAQVPCRCLPCASLLQSLTLSFLR
jgi:hypothetical protein